MILSILFSIALLVCSVSSFKSDLGHSESRGYSSHATGPPPGTYEQREPEATYSKGGRSYESSEDSSGAQEDYVPKSQPKKTVILAIPVKLALQQAEREKSSYESSGESYGSGPSAPRGGYTSYTSYADQPARSEAGNGNNNGYNSNNQYQYSVAEHSQNNNQQTYSQLPAAYTASASQGYAQSAPVTYAPTRDQGERHIRTYSDKSPAPKPYNPDNDIEANSYSNARPISYSGAQSYEQIPKLPRPSPYAEDTSYEVEEPLPRLRKTHKRPAAYVEESVDDDTYSSHSSSSGRHSAKYAPAETESDPYAGLDAYPSGFQSELSALEKGSSGNTHSYGGEALDDTDYSSALASLGLQSYSSPSLPQSELSYLMSKMPRGFSPVPAASSSHALGLGGSRPGSFGYGYPSRPLRRPYIAPPHYGPAGSYLKSPFAGSSFPLAPSASKMYLPAASSPYKSYSPYYGAASSPLPATASSPFRFSSGLSSGLGIGKAFSAGKGLRIGPLEFGSSGTLFPTIKIKSPVRV